MYFKDIIGHQALKKQLIQEVKNHRVAHAQLFAGAVGVGKLPMAIAYARYLCCSNKQAGDACGQCPSCKMMDKLVHPDVHFIFPIVKSTSPKREKCDDYIFDWRKMVLENQYFELKDWLAAMKAGNKQAVIYTAEGDEIRRKLSLKSSEGGYKVVILWLPERMHEAFANKILKLLEEPPEETVIIMVSDDTEPIIQTIISRLQQRLFDRIPEDLLTSYLVENNHYGQQMASQFAHMAKGSVNNMRLLIDQDSERVAYFQSFVNLMRLCYARKIHEMRRWSNDTAKKSREDQLRLIQYCQEMIRENFIFNFHESQMNYMTVNEQQFSSKFARFVNEKNVYQIMHELDEVAHHIKHNVNAKMVFFDFSLKMIVLLQKGG